MLAAFLQGGAWAAEPGVGEVRNAAGQLAAATTGHESGGAEGLPTAAPILFHVGPLPVTNAMVVTWVVALLLIVAMRSATRRMQLVPSGAQNFWEWLVESLYDFLEGIVGTELVKKTFWFFSALFILILATNWFGLLPGVGTVGWGVQTAHGFHVTQPLLRGANADFNMTFAMAMVFFGLWTIWANQANGFGGLIKHIFAPKGVAALAHAARPGALKILMIVIFAFVGLLEIVSIMFRPVSLSFRLYGNVYAGENMLEAMTHIGGPFLGWLTALPFYCLEVLVGIVQALVFMLLTSVFTLLICSHDEDDPAHRRGHGPEPADTRH